MGCASSTPSKLPRHADDRELEVWDIEEVEVESVDETFKSTYAPVLSAIDLNNDMVAGTDRVKIAVAALLGAYTLHLRTQEKEWSVPEVQVVIEDGEKKALEAEAVQKLVTENAEFGRNFTILKKMVGIANKKIAEVWKKEKKPASIVQLKDFKLQCQSSEGKRFVDAELNATMDNMNIQAFHVAHDLLKVSFKDAFDLFKAIKNAFVKIMEELKDKLVPELKANVEKLMEGEIELALSLGDFDPMSLLPPALATVYQSIMDLIELVKGAPAKLAEIKPQVEEVPEKIQNFDAQAAVKEAAAGDPLKLPSLLRKVTANSSYAPGAPNTLKHTGDTALAIVGDLKAAFEDTFKK